MPHQDQYVKNYMAGLLKEGKIGKNPLLVIDGSPIPYNSFQENEIPINEEQIYTLGFLDSGKGANLFGQYGQDGIVLITTRLNRLKTVIATTESNVLFKINGINVTIEEVRSLRDEEIGYIEIIEDDKAIKNLGAREYESVILITQRHND